MNPIIATLMSFTFLLGCAHNTIESKDRNPASLDKYRKVAETTRYEFFVGDVDRCDHTDLAERLSQETIQSSIGNFNEVSLKLDAILKKIRTVNPEKADLIENEIFPLAVLFDGADSVDCGAVAAPDTVAGRRRQVLFVSTRGATKESWRTVIPHEFSHLIMKKLGFDTGPLWESWVDLMALSVNDYRPYFAEGDGVRTLALIEKNRKRPDLNEALKESFDYSCVSRQAQRDFRIPRSLTDAYRGLHFHNTSCSFVYDFLRRTKSNRERDRRLYTYLFGGGLTSKPTGLYSANFARTLNELLEENVGGTSRTKTFGDLALETQSNDDKLTIKVELPLSLRASVVRNAARPVSLEIREEPHGTVFQWSKFLDLYEPDLELMATPTCDRISKCHCLKGGAVKLELNYLETDGRHTTVTSEFNMPAGCFVKN